MIYIYTYGLMDLGFSRKFTEKMLNNQVENQSRLQVKH